MERQTAAASAVTPEGQLTSLLPHWRGFLLLATALIYFVYRRAVDPLCNYPGPMIASYTDAYRSFFQVKGVLPQHLSYLHDKYGPVVRIGPRCLSFISSAAWSDIYGIRKATEGGNGFITLEKDLDEDLIPLNQAPSLIYSHNEDHARHRRVLSNAFSTKALRSYDETVVKSIDSLISTIHCQVASSTATENPLLDTVRAVVLDLVGELLFGKSLGCLTYKDGVAAHPLCKTSVLGFKELSTFLALRRLIPPSVQGMIPERLIVALTPALTEGDLYAASRVHDRMESMATMHNDFLGNALKIKDQNKGLSKHELENAFGLLLFAGSETMITVLTCCIYYIASMPHLRTRLQNEVRCAASKESLTLENVSSLRYLGAVIEEAMRIMSPVPITLPRVCPKGGLMVCGQFVPEGTSMGVAQVAACWSESNFKNAKQFVPERWLDDPIYVGDDGDANRPFSYGPRGCLGKYLARPTMQLLLARLVENFDMSCESSPQDWVFEQEAHFTWQKPQFAAVLERAGR